MTTYFEEITQEAFADELQKIAALRKDEASESFKDSARMMGRQLLEGWGGGAAGAGTGAGIGALIAKAMKSKVSGGATAGAIALGVPGLAAGMVHGTKKSLRGAEGRFEKRYGKKVNFHGGKAYGSQLLGGLVGSPIPIVGQTLGSMGGAAMYMHHKKKQAMGK